MIWTSLDDVIPGNVEILDDRDLPTVECGNNFTGWVSNATKMFGTETEVRVNL